MDNILLLGKFAMKKRNTIYCILYKKKEIEKEKEMCVCCVIWNVETGERPVLAANNGGCIAEDYSANSGNSLIRNTYEGRIQVYRHFTIFQPIHPLGCDL